MKVIFLLRNGEGKRWGQRKKRSGKDGCENILENHHEHLKTYPRENGKCHSLKERERERRKNRNRMQRPFPLFPFSCGGGSFENLLESRNLGKEVLASFSILNYNRDLYLFFFSPFSLSLPLWPSLANTRPFPKVVNTVSMFVCLCSMSNRHKEWTLWVTSFIFAAHKCTFSKPKFQCSCGNARDTEYNCNMQGKKESEEWREMCSWKERAKKGRVKLATTTLPSLLLSSHFWPPSTSSLLPSLKK